MSLPLASRRTVSTWLVRAVTEHRDACAVMLALFAASTAAGLVGPRLLGGLVESVGTATAAHVDRVAVAFLGFLLLQAVLKAWARSTAAVFGERLLAAAREQLVGHVVRLPVDTVEAAGSGELLGRATADVDKLDEGLRQAAPHILVAAVTVLLTAVAMVLTSPPLAAVALVTVPVLVAATRWYRPRAVPTYERALSRWARVYAATHETHEGGRTVDALGLADRRIAGADRALRVVAAVERRSGWLWAAFLASLELAAVPPVAALLLVGGWAYSRGWVGVGELTAVLLYTRALAEPVGEVLGWMDELQVGHAALRRVLGVRELPAEAEDDRAPEPAGPELRLDGVRFGYRVGREVLHGVTLSVGAGERLAVVGPSGAGKSTLGRLLAGVGVPTGGRVTVGGVDVAALPQARRRRAVMLVTQEQHVFAGTLRDNLTLAGPAADDRLRAALDAVGWTVPLPHGLDTVVGSGGHPVRAAEAQRLALARVLLADPAAVVLDEATSLLDGGCPPGVLDGRTVVTIAHRLEAARDADRVAVLVGGRVAELGSHAELLAAGGEYAALWSAYRDVAR